MSGRQAAGHADFVQASIARSDAAHSALVASWRRSFQLHHLDPAERKAPRRLTEAGRKLVLDEFSVDAMCEGNLAIYRRLLQGHGKT